MDSDQLRRLMRDVGDAVAAYQRGHGFLGIEQLPDEIERLSDPRRPSAEPLPNAMTDPEGHREARFADSIRQVLYERHARELRSALQRKDNGAVLRELILVLETLERERG